MDKKIYQLLEDGKVHVHVLDMQDIMNDLNDMGVVYWVFPIPNTDEMLVELDIKEEAE